MQPGTAEHLQQGLALHRQGRLADAQAAYEAILAREPRHFDALHLLAVLLAQAGRFDEALTAFDRAVALQPNVAALHFNRGRALRD